MSRKCRDLTGQRFGLWIVLEHSHIVRNGRNVLHYWKCRCNCGVERTVIHGSLIFDRSTSCGCDRIHPQQRIDLSGQRFGRWTVIGFSGIRDGKAYWLCLCDCGTERAVQGTSLRKDSRGSLSCGCYAREVASSVNATHGHTRNYRRSDIYAAWAGMMDRCSQSNEIAIANYSGRGIAVCERWHDFANFLADMGEKPPRTSLDRIDNNGNYEPGNCRWATMRQQSRNKRNNRILEYDGESHCLTEWSEIVGINTSTLWARINRGWPIGEALTKPELC